MPGNPNPSPATRFKPGQSGNPGGHRAKPVTVELRKLLDAADGKAASALAKVVLTNALKGDIAFVKEVLDRVEGKPVATVEIKQDETRQASPEAEAFVARLKGSKPAEVVPIVPSNGHTNGHANGNGHASPN